MIFGQSPVFFKKIYMNNDYFLMGDKVKSHKK